MTTTDPERPRHLLTISVEAFHQSAAMARHLDDRQRSRLDARIEPALDLTLDLLDEIDASATFFVLGGVAADHPGAIRQIAQRGHEVASRTWDPVDIDHFNGDAGAFCEDVRRARTAVEQAAGAAVRGFRIPRGRLGPEHGWALDVLASERFVYDSSFFPRWGEARRRPFVRFGHVHEHDGEELVELPISSCGTDNTLLPIGGGAAFRQLPSRLVLSAIADWTRRYRSPFNMYFNLWEFDQQLPRLAVGGWFARLRQYRNIGRTERVLRTLGEHHTLESIGDHLVRIPYTSCGCGCGRTTINTPPRQQDSLISKRPTEPDSPLAEPVTIVVPCYNESATIPYLRNTLRELGERFGRDRLSYIFVDDGSADDTHAALARLCEGSARCRVIHNQTNSGIASAIMDGIRAAETELVCSIDADCSYDPRQIAELVDAMDDRTAMVTASPYHPDGTVRHVPGWRLALSRSLSWMYRRMLAHRLHTYTACMRLHRRSVYADMDLKHPGFLGLVEIIQRTDAKQWDIAEVPAVLESRLLGVSKMKTMHTIRAHLGLLVRQAAGRGRAAG